MKAGNRSVRAVEIILENIVVHSSFNIATAACTLAVQVIAGDLAVCFCRNTPDSDSFLFE